MFERFENRYDLRGRIITKTALHIGAGGSLAVVGSDNPVVRDVNGLPYIPGSSFKGALRSFMESMVRALSPGDRQEPWACDPLTDTRWCIRRGKVLPQNQPYTPDKSYEAIGFEDLLEAAQKDDEKLAHWVFRESCTICRLFGSPWLASRLKICDLYLNTGGSSSMKEAHGGAKKRRDQPEPLTTPEVLPRIEIRDGVAIDRDTETAAAHRKYDFEVVPREKHFNLHIRVDNVSNEELGLLFLGLREFNRGEAWVGGNTSRGLGLVRIEWDEFEIVEGRAGLLAYLKSGKGTERRGDDIAALISEKTQAFLETLNRGGSEHVEEVAQPCNDRGDD